jgi:hypothetical protein
MKKKPQELLVGNGRCAPAGFNTISVEYIGPDSNENSLENGSGANHDIQSNRLLKPSTRYQIVTTY